MCFPILPHISLYVAKATKNKDIVGTIIPKVSRGSTADGINNFTELVKQYYTDIYYVCLNDITNYIQKIGDQLGKTIRFYLADNQKRVTEMINGNNGQALDEQAKCIQADVSEINIRKEKLNVINQMLTLMSRKG